MRRGWTRARINTALIVITVVAVGCGVGALWLLAVVLGVDVSRWSR